MTSITAFFQQVYADGSLLVLWGALLFHLLVPIPRSAHPTQLWKQFALLLAKKVNRNNSYQQSVISGTLAMSLMLFPAFVLLVAIKPLVWQPALFDLALLLLAIDWRSNEKLASQQIKFLANENKAAARKALSGQVNRSTDTLSLLGLGKASAETLVLGYGRNVITVLFWYSMFSLVGLGGIIALTYRLLVELARVWSPTRKSFSPFGLATTRLLALFDVIPMRLFSLLLLIGRTPFELLKATLTQAKSWHTPGPGWLLTSCANKLQLSLGGPAIYDDIKAVRAKIGGRLAPSYLHLAQLQKLFVWRIFIWILLLSLFILFTHQGL